MRVLPTVPMRPPELVVILYPTVKLVLALIELLPGGRLWIRLKDVRMAQLLFRHPPTAPVPVGDLMMIMGTGGFLYGPGWEYGCVVVCR